MQDRHLWLFPLVPSNPLWLTDLLSLTWFLCINQYSDDLSSMSLSLSLCITLAPSHHLDKPAPLLMLKSAWILLPTTLILEETTNKWLCLMHCTHYLLEHWGQATTDWYLWCSHPLPSPDICCALQGPADGLLLSCHRAQWQHRHCRVVF